MLISKFCNENTDVEIENFEKRYNFKFPLSYREFLLKYNGGITAETTVILNEEEFSDIVGFYGFDTKHEYLDFIKLENKDILQSFIKNGMLLIAHNVFGDYFSIGIKKNNFGKVYFLYHDQPEKVLLADKFENFISACKSEEIGYIPTIEERKKMVTANGLGDKISRSLIKSWKDEIEYYKNIHQEDVIL